MWRRFSARQGSAEGFALRAVSPSCSWKEAIVVTPLIALMKDQVQNLQERGIKALAVHAGMKRHDVDLALNNAAYDPDCKFLYVSPERLNTDLFKSYCNLLPINFIVVGYMGWE